MRLTDGTLWPMPITPDVPGDLAAKLGAAGTPALRDPEGIMLAALHVADVWEPDRKAEAEAVFGTAHAEHPDPTHIVRSIVLSLHGFRGSCGRVVDAQEGRRSDT